jgi:hypothetical protein
MPTTPQPGAGRRRAPRALALGLLAAGALAGCNDFIAAPSAVANPNNPTQASNNQLLVGVEVNQTALLTGDLARTIGLWMQQFSGTQGQYVSYATYVVAEDFTDGAWGTIYQGGGLQDLRLIQSRADASGDSVTAGIARVIEGLVIGTAADFWGDVPTRRRSSSARRRRAIRRRPCTRPSSRCSTAASRSCSRAAGTARAAPISGTRATG